MSGTSTLMFAQVFNLLLECRMKALVNNPHQLKYITKKNEYRAFLDLIKAHKLAVGKRKGYNILAISKALNIDRKTLKSWLETPEARGLIQAELEYYLNMMMKSGKDDWRQWKAQVDLALNISNDSHTLQANTTIMIVSNKEEFEIVSQ